MKFNILMSHLLKGELCHFPSCAWHILEHLHIGLGENDVYIDAPTETFTEDSHFLKKDTYVQSKIFKDHFPVDTTDL